jgi:hypothetical protein
MPKAIDTRLLDVIERAYLTRPSRPTLESLSKEFGVSLAKLKQMSRDRNWAVKRDTMSIGELQGAKKAALALQDKGKINDLNVLNQVISLLLGSATITEPRSQEGCANALANLIKTKRELFPPDVDALAEIAVAQGITATDFLEALTRRWEMENAKASG